MSVEILRTHAARVRRSDAAVQGALSRLLAYERQDHPNFADAHRALRDLGAAMQEATAAMRALAAALGSDPDALLSDDVDAIVPPLLEEVPVKKYCECKTGERTPLNCWSCSAND